MIFFKLQLFNQLRSNIFIAFNNFMNLTQQKHPFLSANNIFDCYKDLVKPQKALSNLPVAKDIGIYQNTHYFVHHESPVQTGLVLQ